jgi:hypothetical protein
MMSRILVAGYDEPLIALLAAQIGDAAKQVLHVRAWPRNGCESLFHQSCPRDS